MLKDWELISYKTYAELKAESERTYIGFIWWVVEPIITMSIFYVVFHIILQRSTPDFIPFLLIGVVAWKWFNTAIKQGANQIMANINLMRQSYIRKYVFTVSSVLRDSVKFLFSFVLLVIFLTVYGLPPTITYTAIPLLMGIHFLLILALSLCLAAIYPFIPDLHIVIDHILHILLYLSGIFYTLSSVPHEVRTFIMLNPMAHIIESYRAILLHHEWPKTIPLLLIAGMSVVGIVGGIAVMKRFDKIYPRLSS